MKLIVTALIVATIGTASLPAAAASPIAAGGLSTSRPAQRQLTDLVAAGARLGATSPSIAFQTGSVGTAANGMLSVLSLPPPVPFFAPPARRVRTLVGVDTWFWVTAASWRPIVRIIPVGKVVVMLVATPVTLQLVPGDGTPLVSCPGPGVPWLWPGTRSLCSHTFQRTSMSRPFGRFSATVQTVWTIRWTSNTGASGVAGPVVVPTPVSLRVAEAQAVLGR
ncbi:hypothetical protein [Candidatus Poriferisodalis sp.]|uniref:hypothetical protein n=1 Tax=Candidatus Poriferisodalis sp. TaxID=3101277 RepID=UPI003B029C20